MKEGLAVVETHPIQYHAPVYRMVQQRFGIPVTVIYGSDFSVAGYRDPGFQTSFAWDTDLLSGYRAIFLSRVAEDGGKTITTLSPCGLRQALRQADAAAILLTGYSPRFHRLVLLHVLRAGMPTLFRGETTDFSHPRGRVLSWIRDHALRAFYGRCERLLYIGQRSLWHFQRLGCPEEKLVYSPYAVSTAPFQCDEAARERLRPVTRRQLEVIEGQIVLLFSGKLIRHKAPLLFLRSLKLLPADLLRRLVVVYLGSGPLEEEARQLAQTPPTISARFVGFQNQTRLSPYYHGADLVVLPSRHWETWGLVVNEALHHGVPCIVSESVGCAPDLIEAGMTGEIFRTEHPPSLVAAAERAFELVGRPEIRHRCRQKVSGFTVEKAAEGIAEAYAKAMGLHRGG